MTPSANNLKTIKGTIENIVYVNSENGYAVVDVSDENNELFTAVGILSELCVGENVVLHGYVKAHVNFGEQFRVEAFEVSLPESEKSIRKFLAGGALPYVGPAMANKLVDLYKEKTLEVISTDVDKIAVVKGISLKKAQRIQDEFKRMFAIRDAIAYLSKLNINTESAILLFKHYGKHTNEIVKSNPYILCDYPTFSPFDLADNIAYDFCMEYNCTQRVNAGVLYILRHNLQNGHTCIPLQQLFDTASDFLRVEPDEIKSAFDNLLSLKNISVHEINEKTFVFLPEYLTAETNIALHLKQLIKFPKADLSQSEKLIQKLEIIAGIEYAPLQKKAILEAITQKVLVLTGGPGTGKTTTVNGIISAFEMLGDRVSLTAPTGRAAKRLCELTKRKATTIHRLLEVDFSKDNVVKFIHNEKNLLKTDVVIIDEMSMVDTLLFDSLLCALKPNCKIIMVGDEDQLPSVGAGNVLGSVLSSGAVPYVRLNEVFRQAAQSDIVSNAHKIVAGESLQLKGRDSDFFIIENQNTMACVELVCDLVSKRLPKTYNYDMLEDIQVLCPTKIGALGTVALNASLQEKINPYSETKPQLKFQNRIFRKGDKVMQIKNNYDLPFKKLDTNEEDAGVFNGDLGIISHVEPKMNTVTVISEDREIVYPIEFLHELELAYAITIHKSQGSEFKAIIVPLLDVPQRLCYRNLLYTGVTRAKDLCIIAGQPSQAAKMINNARQNKRYSCLSQFLQEE